jgi:hypothetical protein
MIIKSWPGILGKFCCQGKVLWMDPRSCRCSITIRHKHELCENCLYKYSQILLYTHVNDKINLFALKRFLNKPSFWNKKNEENVNIDKKSNQPSFSRNKVNQNKVYVNKSDKTTSLKKKMENSCKKSDETSSWNKKNNQK